VELVGETFTVPPLKLRYPTGDAFPVLSNLTRLQERTVIKIQNRHTARTGARLRKAPAEASGSGTGICFPIPLSSPRSSRLAADSQPEPGNLVRYVSIAGNIQAGGLPWATEEALSFNGKTGARDGDRADATNVHQECRTGTTTALADAKLLA